MLHSNISTRTTYGIQAWQKASRSHAASLQAMVNGRAHTVRTWGGGKIRAVRKEKQRAYKKAQYMHALCVGGAPPDPACTDPRRDSRRPRTQSSHQSLDSGAGRMMC